MKAEIIAPDYGRHNALIDESIRRLDMSGVYKDLSTIIIIPAIGGIPAKVVSSWMNLIHPPNQKVYRMWAMGMEVGEAYSQSIQNVQNHPELAKYKYVLTIETDNVPEPDGLVRLLQRLEQHPELSAVGGLYWTKGPDGVPQIWGDPKRELNFQPQRPVPGELVECCGTANGFTLFRNSMFADTRLRKPWFQTKAEIGAVYTQDLWFWEDARKYGYRCAIDCGVLVGHYDEKGTFGIPDYTW